MIYSRMHVVHDRGSRAASGDRLAGGRLPGTQGFALVELAIVIVIMSLLLGGGLLALNSQTENQRINTTHRQLDVIKVALENFIARNGRLPCPAKADLPPSNAAYGVEATPVDGTSTVAATCTGTIAAGGGFKGVVPWVTLGLTGPEVLDGWSHRITYHVALQGVFLDSASPARSLDTVSGMRGALTVHNATPVAAGLPATGNQTNACTTTAGDNSCNSAAVVVLVSHGKNGLGAWQESGTQLPLPAAGSREEVNADSNASYLVMQVYESNDAQHFDDLVLALAPRDVLTPLVASGQVKAERAALSDGFEAIKSGVLSWALEHPNGGGDGFRIPNTGTEFTTAFAGGNVPKDPWGNPYNYVRVVSEIKASTGPGTAYTMYSSGSDRNPGSGPTDGDNISIDVTVNEIKAILAKTGF